MPTFDNIPDGEDFPVSATLFVTYLRCPQQALGRLQGIFGPPSRASFKGALAHRLFARHLDDGAIDGDDFDRVCRQETGANLNAQMAAAGIKPSEFRAVVNEVREIYDTFTAMPMDGFSEAEASFESEVGGGVRLRGRIDAVFTSDVGDRIVDWKTGSYLAGDTEAQLGFYALAWEKIHGSPPSASEAISVTTGETVGVEVSAESLAETESEVAMMVTELRAAMAAGTELERSAGPHCSWCPLLEDCSEGRAAEALLT